MTGNLISYLTVRRVVAEPSGPVSVFTRSNWPTMSGSRFDGLVLALMTLGLLDAKSLKPTKRWHDLSQLNSCIDRTEALATLIKERFPAGWMLASEGGSIADLEIVMADEAIDPTDATKWAKFVGAAWRDGDQEKAKVPRRRSRSTDLHAALEAKRVRDWGEFWRRLATDSDASAEQRLHYLRICEDVTRHDLEIERSAN